MAFLSCDRAGGGAMSMEFEHMISPISAPASGWKNQFGDGGAAEDMIIVKRYVNDKDRYG